MSSYDPLPPGHEPDPATGGTAVDPLASPGAVAEVRERVQRLRAELDDVNDELLHPFGHEPFGPEVFGPEVFGPEVFGPEVFGPEVFGPGRPDAPHLVPSADIWDDDPDVDVDVDADADADAAVAGWLSDPAELDETRWRDAQVVVHGLDGEPIEEPLDDPVYDGRADEAMSSRLSRWGRESVAGAAMMGFGRGIERVLRQPEPAEVLYEVDDDDEQPDKAVSLLLVPDHPERSIAVVRPWLLRRRKRSADPGPG